MDTQKIKSVAKSVTPRGSKLSETVLRTMSLVSQLVGDTLGPGGCPVLIERPEFNLPPMVTKDGVTVFRAIGLDDPTAHCVMEAARDAAVRTANEAGDGTTTATILAEAIVRRTHIFCEKNPHASPQSVVRAMEDAFGKEIEPLLRSVSIQPDPSTKEGRSLLFNVARISANGERDLAKAVMECYDAVGDDGNVTIVEANGPSHYEVEQIRGFPISMGYEDSCGKFSSKWVNEPSRQICRLERPVFICYFGRLTEIQTAVMLLSKIGEAWQTENHEHNVVLAATGFSESVLAHLAVNMASAGTINVFPLLVPPSPMPNGQLDFLEDLCALTGATLLDSMNRPMDTADLDVLGRDAALFESMRFRSLVFPRGIDPESGRCPNEDNILVRKSILEAQAQNAASQLERTFLQERIGKLTGGIAKLTVVGSSTGELREKRDRAEDAVCAVRGAIKHGCLPGGGWALALAAHTLYSRHPAGSVLHEVLAPALEEPVDRLLSNVGFTVPEIAKIRDPMHQSIRTGQPPGPATAIVYDALTHRHVNALDDGLLDSAPAVIEAIRSAISIAGLLGTLGGTVVYKRDLALERTEAEHAMDFLRADEPCGNPANERG